MTEETQKDLLSSQINIKHNVFDSPLARCFVIIFKKDMITIFILSDEYIDRIT